LSHRKSHNSILVLATLGVYLGLVLVGATPQVLAQKRLDTAVAFKRDASFACPNNSLINGERAEDLAPFDYDLAKRIIELYKATQVRLEFTKVDQPELLGTYSFFFDQIDFAPYVNKKGKLIDDDWKSDSSEWASASHAGQMVDLNSLFLNPLADCTKATERKIPFASSHFEVDDNELKLELTVAKASESRAAQLATSIRALFDKRRADTEDQAIKSIYQSTEIRSEVNKLIIVTRLPRAGLDSLLANDAK
jgi:hypothetical protein